MLLLLSGRNRFSLSCNPSWGCELLVVCHGVVSQLGEHLFHSWGCDNHWWDNHWRDNHWWDSLSSLPLEIPINFAIVRLQPFLGYFGNFPSAQNLFRIFLEPLRPPLNLSRIFLEAFRPPLKSFQDILDKFLEINFPFPLQPEFLIKLSQTNFHLLEFVCGHKSSSALVIRPLDSNCGFCLSCAVFEQLSQLLS